MERERERESPSVVDCASALDSGMSVPEERKEGTEGRKNEGEIPKGEQVSLS